MRPGAPILADDDPPHPRAAIDRYGLRLIEAEAVSAKPARRVREA